MTHTIKLDALPLGSAKTYLFTIVFVVGNLLLPQLAHLIPQGGLIFLPIYFFTLIAAYKYGIHVGVLTAILSPLVNNLLFSMPPTAVLPAILVKSILLALAASYMAKKVGKVSVTALLFVVLAYQLFGTAVEWVLTKNFLMAVQDFRIGVPGILIQIVAGYFLLKAIEKV